MDDCTKRQIRGPLIPESFYTVDRLQKYMHMGFARSYPKGSIVLSQGAETNSLIYVQSGCLSVSMSTDDGQSKYLFHIGESSIGMTTFLSESHELQITAVKDSTVCFFRVEQLLEIFKDDQQVILDILQNILSKVYYFMSQARDLNFYRPSSRILRLLYNLCVSEGKFTGDCYVVQSNMTQKTIGNITGTHHVTVCKLLNVLEKQHILKKTKDEIIVYDLNKLKNMINEIFEY